MGQSESFLTQMKCATDYFTVLFSEFIVVRCQMVLSRGSFSPAVAFTPA